jgi:hypothetical protein
VKGSGFWNCVILDMAFEVSGFGFGDHVHAPKRQIFGSGFLNLKIAVSGK